MTGWLGSEPEVLLQPHNLTAFGKPTFSDNGKLRPKEDKLMGLKMSESSYQPFAQAAPKAKDRFPAPHREKPVC